MKTNYHTHNYRCNHAVGTIKEYVEEAIKEGFDVIGLSDHLPHPGKNIDNENRMKYEELPEYFKEIDEVKEMYGDKIEIKKGIECEYFPDFLWLYDELREKFKVDYLILGAHFFPYNGKWFYIGSYLTPDSLEKYVNFVIESMESGLFDYIAHPDVFGIGYRDWDEYSIKASRRILKKAEEFDMPIEININGFKKRRMKYNHGERYMYPIREFWELSKEYNVRRIIGVDAHKPKDMRDFQMAIDFAKELGLEVIDNIDLRK